MIKRNGAACGDGRFANGTANHFEETKNSVSLTPPGFSPTRIPQPRNQITKMSSSSDLNTSSKETNIALGTYVEKWKNRYEDSERKHKACLLKSEKARRENEDLLRRHNILAEEKLHLETELAERERQLNKLRQVSEKLFTEYQQLKHQSQLDNGLMQKVMQQAGEWYKQNRQLKRRSTAILNSLPTKPPDLDFTDSLDAGSDTSNNEEIEFLKQTIADLSKQLAECQTELNNVKLQEFEAHELNVNLTQELESERERNQSLSRQVSELVSKMESSDRVSKLLVEEMARLKQNADADNSINTSLKSEVREAKKRVRVLTHQSALLMSDLHSEDRLLTLVQEIEGLRDALEHQADRHHEQIVQLELKLSEKHEDIDILLWEEKIRLAEEDARKAIERAERAERKLNDIEKQTRSNLSQSNVTQSNVTPSNLTQSNVTQSNVTQSNVTQSNVTPSNATQSVSLKDLTRPNVPNKSAEVIRVSEQKLVKTNCLKSRINYFEKGDDKKTDVIVEQNEVIDNVIEDSAPVALSPPPPPPPPPLFAPLPPPPPPPPLPPTLLSPPASSGGQDMASLLANRQGSLRATKQNGPAAIDAIVDQIKGGKFQLKSTDQNFLERKQKDEQPEAVKEMLAILGTLRKRRNNFVVNNQSVNC